MLEGYVSRGWKIFPCHSIVRGQCTCSKGIKCEAPGKHPRTRNGVKDATSDISTITAWATTWPATNWALACGRDSGVVVIDIDQSKGGYSSLDEFESERPDGTLPRTLTAVSGGGGRHLIFGYPSDGSIGNRTNWLKGVDVRSDGGYIIIAPASHISGGTYQWVEESSPIAPMPLDVVESIRSSKTSGISDFSTVKTSDLLNGIPEGERDDAIFRGACRWRRQLGDDGYDGVLHLAYMAADNAKPPFPREQARVKVDQAFKMDHNDLDLVIWSGDAKRHNLTDLGNAKRLVDAYIDDIRYVPQWGWLEWSDTGWVRVGEGPIIQRCTKVSEMVVAEAEDIADTTVKLRYVRHAKSSESAGAISAIEKLARSDPRILMPSDAFDVHDYEIACRNGIVDLRDGSLRPFMRDDLVTKNTNVVYDPNADMSWWQEFVANASNDIEQSAYMQMAAGYTLTGSNAEECFFVLRGPKRSGKSTFVDGMQTAMGSYAVVSQPDTFLYRRGKEVPKDELARLAGMRMTSMSEIREGEGFNEALIKQITGGDRVAARFLYRDMFEFVPKFKLWIATNHDPSTTDDAMLRRLKILAFPKTIPSEMQNPKLKMAVRDPEIGGRAVLRWAVEGAIKWYAGGRLIEPSNVTERAHDYQATHDSFSQFISEHFVASPGEVTLLRDVVSAYNTWASVLGERQLNRTMLIKRLREKGYRISIDDRGAESFDGLALRPVQISAGGVSWS